MSKTTHYELNTPIGSEVLSVMTGLNPNFNTIDETMYDNETRSTQALNKANVNEQNIATALGRITTAEGDIDTLESGLQTANTNISGLTSRMTTAESGLVTANNRIQEHTGQIATLNDKVSDSGWVLFDTTHNAYYRKIGEVVTIKCEGTITANTDLPLTRLPFSIPDFEVYLSVNHKTFAFCNDGYIIHLGNSESSASHTFLLCHTTIVN